VVLRVNDGAKLRSVRSGKGEGRFSKFGIQRGLRALLVVRVCVRVCACVCARVCSMSWLTPAAMGLIHPPNMLQLSAHACSASSAHLGRGGCLLLTHFWRGFPQQVLQREAAFQVGVAHRA
jgi:hypothetical protein